MASETERNADDNPAVVGMAFDAQSRYSKTMRFGHGCLIATAGLLAALALSGCHEHVYRGSTLYQEGRYIEAAETFERTEYSLRQATAAERAEFCLYRGLTFLRLGDLNSAHEWLKIAYQLEREQPGALDPDERKRLAGGWVELKDRAQQQPMAPEGVVATTASSPLSFTGTRADSNGQRSVGSDAARSLVPR